MFLSITGLALGIIAAVFLITLVFIFLYFKQKVKQNHQTDPSKMSDGYFHRSLTIHGKLDNENRKIITQYLDGLNAKIIRGDNQEIIAYLNDLKSSFLRGPKAEWKKLPLRIIFSEKKSNIKIRLDESRGIKKLHTDTVELFTSKHNQLFNHHEKMISDLLEQS